MATKNEANIWQPRTIVNLSANTKQVEEQIVATEGQVEFVVENFTYAKGTGSLTVYKNGKVLSHYYDWSELSPDTGDDNKANSFLLTDANACVAGDVINAIALTEITGSVDTSAASIIAAEPPDFDTYTEATRWWDCRTGKSYVMVENSTGYKQWVEERSPVDPPQYEVTTISSANTELTITGVYHAKFIELTSDSDITITVGRALDASDKFVGALVFIQNKGSGTCTIVPDTDDGVSVDSYSTYVLDGVNATVALIAKSETNWALMGNLQVV